MESIKDYKMKMSDSGRKRKRGYAWNFQPDSDQKQESKMVQWSQNQGFVLKPHWNPGGGELKRKVQKKTKSLEDLERFCF